MRINHSIAVLSVRSIALAAPALSSASGAPLSIDALGPLQALKYNDLGPENNGTAAVLVYERLDQSKAQERCAAIGESLYQLDDSPPADLQYQLDYLVFSNSLKADVHLWIAKNTSSQECVGYSYGYKALVQQPCHLQLPSLCTASVQPTTDTNKVAAESSKISIAVDDHTITGYRDARSFRFLGVPFANPPVGNQRFAPPQPYSGTKEIDATKKGNSCIQPDSPFGTLGNSGISEDCLYLNVYTPILPTAGSEQNIPRKPVAVYFYGGAFIEGSSTLIDYDGGNFASRNDVVVVTVNYRVGALGWLATGNLTTGSYGTRDQILSLQWVKKHIASFGGDPSRVTIFGQSAGGQSVVALLSSSAAQGLFSSAIVQSAPVDIPWYTRDMYARLVVPDVAKSVGCNEAQSEEYLVSCLRSVPAAKFLGNSSEFKTVLQAIAQKVSSKYLHSSALLSEVEPFLPVVDDSGSGVIDDQFDRLLARQSLPNRVPTLFTTVTDEASYYATKIPTMGSTQNALDNLLNTTFPSQLAKSLVNSGAYYINHSDPDGARNAVLDALTHREWSCAQEYVLRHSGQDMFPSLYEVQISQGHPQTTVNLPYICAPNNNFNATCHTSDVLLIWGNLNSKTQHVQPYYDQSDILHSQMLNDMFGSFFRTSDPNPDPAFLKVRGPAYAATYEIFGRNKYRVPVYHPEAKNISLLGIPPGWTENPGLSKPCTVFDHYGYTFQHV